MRGFVEKKKRLHQWLQKRNFIGSDYFFRCFWLARFDWERAFLLGKIATEFMLNLGDV